MVPLVTKDFRRTTLRPRHRPIVRALAEALFSPDGEATPERLDAFVDEVDDFISPASKTLRFGLVMMLGILRWSPLLFGRTRSSPTTRRWNCWVPPSRFGSNAPSTPPPSVVL